MIIVVTPPEAGRRTLRAVGAVHISYVGHRFAGWPLHGEIVPHL
jgi:hypothetical protein